ncbi:MAG: HAD family hydrolase [Bacteroidaceae bacterium]|nr:HAD family hydrolase [Bacteroidaceae bacterium]
MIKGILIDFGGTIDSDGIHWFDQFRDAYALVASVPETLLWDAYVHTERTLGRNPIIGPDYTFCKALQTKIALQTEYLQQHGITVTAQDTILDTCYNKVVKHISTVSKPVLERLSAQYPIVLVTNFYGNMHTVLKEFGLDHLFKDVVESAVVGVRKPDPQIFRLGVAVLGLEPQETVMIGDSQEKDILPAQSIGCQTIQITPSSPLSSFPL